MHAPVESLRAAAGPETEPLPPARPGNCYDNDPIRPPRKRRAPISEYKYVRRVGGNAWQARVWLGSHNGGSLNLGLFTISEHPADPKRPADEMAEYAANRARQEFARFYNPTRSGRGLRETFDHLKRKRVIPQGVLPPRVYAVEGGYTARATVRGTPVALDTVYACPWACYAAMCGRLAELFPRGPSKSEVKARRREEEERKRAEEKVRRYGYSDAPLVDCCA